MALKSKRGQLIAKHARHHIKGIEILINKKKKFKYNSKEIDRSKPDWSIK